MRRAHAILVILALLATPMALLARSDCDPSTCGCMCALVSKSLSDRAHHRPMLCGQPDAAAHHCTMNTSHHPPDYGLNTMMAPTAPHPVVALSVPIVVAPFPAAYAFSMPSGFLAAPFQPPRT
ncbi:MAG TPA: hypothetical protein VMD78_17460 [Candidatus Baltobacteraceae bacterium]|nr:hypothetical protein [Candidatus Baltobacteraceae bacterium]